jgi:hypothetical protein
VALPWATSTLLIKCKHDEDDDDDNDDDKNDDKNDDDKDNDDKNDDDDYSFHWIHTL